MSINSPLSSSSSSLLADYALFLGSEQQSDRINITVDEHYRIQLSTLADSRVLMKYHLCALPEPGLARDQLLEQAARRVCGMMNRYATAAVVDEAENALWLQRIIAANSVRDIDEGLGDFVNELASWSAFPQ